MSTKNGVEEKKVENKGKNGEELVTPLTAKVFPEVNTNVYLHSASKRNLAYIIIFLQRAVGKENVIYSKPWFNQKLNKWIVEVGVKIPKTLTETEHYYSIVSKEEGNGNRGEDKQ